MLSSTRPILLCLAILLAAQTGLAENITELRIESITTPIEAGGRLQFSFTAGNMDGPACSAQIEYGFADKDEKSTQGTDNFYLNSGKTISRNISLIMPSELKGVKDFYLQMTCNESTILASRVIEISGLFPEIPQVTTLKIEESEEGTQLKFGYAIESSGEEKVAISVEETILQDNNVVWTNAQNIAVSGSTQIERFGPLLPPGNYQLIVEARHGSETARIAREFSVGTAVPPPIAILPTLGIALLVGLLLAGTFWASRRFVIGKSAYVEELPEAKPVEARQTEHKICPVAADSSGVLDGLSLETLLDGASFTGKARENAIRFAESTPVTQAVNGCIVTDKSGMMACETTVTVTLSNNTNRNWNKLVLFAEIPEFFAEKFSEIESDCEMHSVKGASIVGFLLPKARAMQKTSISYKVAKMISQAEANSVPLPAVIKYKLGKPLVIAQVNVEKPAKEEKKKAVATKKARNKKAKKKKN